MEDLEQYEWPEKEDALDKIDFDIKPFMRIWWYFKDEEEFWKNHDVEISLQFSGVVVPKPDISMNGGPIDICDAHVIQDEYPTEKSYPMVQYFSLSKLLDNDDLVKVVKVDQIIK